MCFFLGYPTNVLPRFYSSQILGGQIQLILTVSRLNFMEELIELFRQEAFVSENEKTKGVLAPNEFWCFLRRFLPEFNWDVWIGDEGLKDLPAVEQAAGQVCAINGAINNGLQNVSPGRKVSVSYEELQADPVSMKLVFW